MKRLFLSFLMVVTALADDWVPLVREGELWNWTPAEWKLALNGESCTPVSEYLTRLNTASSHTFGTLTPDKIELGWKYKQMGLQNLILTFHENTFAGEESKMAVTTHLRETMAALDTGLGVKGKLKPQKGKLKLRLAEWRWETGAARLAVSPDGTQQLVIAADASGLPPLKEPTKFGTSNLKRHVRKENGLVWIEGIPTLPQGKETADSLAVALCRVLNYYGTEVTREKLEDAIDPPEKENARGNEIPLSAEERREEQWHRASRLVERTNLRIETILSSRCSLKSVYAQYNRWAKKKERPALPETDDGANLVKARPAGLRAAGCADPASGPLKTEFARVRQQVDAGTPVLWLVGDHARLIVGYDANRQDVLYSDAWGEHVFCEHIPYVIAKLIANRLVVIAPER